MKKSIDFFYRVAKEAGFAEDEDGNPSDCYLKIGFNLKKPVSAEKDYAGGRTTSWSTDRKSASCGTYTKI